MKHVGLNVASDPFMTLAYTGIKGGFVIVVADDPNVHSSQNEQDSGTGRASPRSPCSSRGTPPSARSLRRSPST